jgi:hypothetical protein
MGLISSVTQAGNDGLQLSGTPRHAHHAGPLASEGLQQRLAQTAARARHQHCFSFELHRASSLFLQEYARRALPLSAVPTYWQNAIA